MQRLKPYNEGGNLNVIIETPKASPFKNSYDPELQLFRLSKCLPMGMHFPYDFGFIPGTRGEDGDPLDILVLSNYPLCVGCLASVALIGVLEAEQTEKESKKLLRNDRLIGCLQSDSDGNDIIFSHVKDLPRKLAEGIEDFFIQYNRLEGNRFRPMGWYGPKRAHALVEAGIGKSKQR